MSDIKVSALLALSLISSPIGIPASIKKDLITTPTETISSRTSNRRMRLQLTQPQQLKTIGTYVGELQEKWQFPSDHLPIGMTFDQFHLLSWNVLNSAYMSWVTEKNSQGLSRSQIADEHVYIGNSKLTIRDQHVAALVLETIHHPTHPRSLLCLQECSKPFIQELRSRLPSNYKLIASGEEIFVYDQTQFEMLEVKKVSGVFTDEPRRTFQDILLMRRDNGEQLRLLNAHLPGDPTKPGPEQFAQYLQSTFDPSLATIAMGDMNFNELEMTDAFAKTFSSSPFQILSPYPTNISPYVYNSKAIDHFFVYFPSPTTPLIDWPDHIMKELVPIVSLLEGETPRIAM